MGSIQYIDGPDDIIVRAGNDEYIPIQAFIDDIKNEIYEAVLYRSDYWTKIHRM